jgi:hypothetical protein
LLEELRRRNVFRVGAAYLVGAWLVAQVGSLLADTYIASAWIMRSVIGALAVGPPVALILAGVYELTPRGVVRERERAQDLLARQRASRRFDRGLIVLLTVALIYFVADKLPCKVVAGAATCCPGHELSMSTSDQARLRTAGQLDPCACLRLLRRYK